MPDIQKMSVVERVALGKKKIKNVVDRIIELMALAEQNDIIVHSKTLSSQIPRSYAANAFKIFQNSLHRQEIVLLCSFWDKPDASLAHSFVR